MRLIPGSTGPVCPKSLSTKPHQQPRVPKTLLQINKCHNAHTCNRMMKVRQLSLSTLSSQMNKKRVEETYFVRFKIVTASGQHQS